MVSFKCDKQCTLSIHFLSIHPSSHLSVHPSIHPSIHPKTIMHYMLRWSLFQRILESAGRKNHMSKYNRNISNNKRDHRELHNVKKKRQKFLDQKGSWDNSEDEWEYPGQIKFSCRSVCVCVCVFVHMCTYVYVCMSVCLSVCIWMLVCMFMYVRICICLSVCVYVYMCVVRT